MPKKLFPLASFKSLICLLFLLFSFAGHAQFSGIENGTGRMFGGGISNYAYTFYVQVGDVDDSRTDTRITELSFKINNEEIFKIINKTSVTTQPEFSISFGDRTEGDAADGHDTFDWWLVFPNQETKNAITATYSDHFTNPFGKFTFILPSRFLLSGMLTISASNENTETGSENFFETIISPVLPSQTDVRVSPSCKSVKLSWDKLNIAHPFALSEFKYKIYKDTVALAIGTLAGNETEFKVSNVSTETEYKVKLYWNDKEIQLKTQTGAPYDPLAIPAELQATRNKCDGTVELKWQWSQSSPTNFVVYKSDNALSGFTLVSDDISGSKRSYIVTGLTRGKEYYFKIAAKGGKCPDEGPKSEEEVIGMSPLDPLTPINTIMDMGTEADSGINLTWNEKQWLAVDFKNATDQKYKIYKKDLKKGTETTIDIEIGDLYDTQIKGKTRDATNGFSISYLDKEVSSCESYSYKIVAVNNCKTTTATIFTKADSTDKMSVSNVDLSRVFLLKNLETSKGYYGNLVQLDWKSDENADFVGNYKIYRRILNSVIIPELQITVDKNTRSWSDNRALAQTLYEYYVVAEADCGLDKLLSYDISLLSGKPFSQVMTVKGLASGIGFRLPAGIITGNINYTGGIAVPNVKVVAEKDGAVTGNSLSFNGSSDYVKINPDAKSIVYSSTGFSTSVWLKPKQLSGTQTITKQVGVFTIELVGSKVKVTIGTTSLTSVANLVVDTYSNVFATRNGTELVLYINGKKDSSVAKTGVLPSSSTSAIYLGGDGSVNYYNGLLDEFRIYKSALTAADVERDYSRLIQAETPNIVGNWRFDEGFGPFVFDSSKEGGVYNKTDGNLVNATWSAEVPSKVQLGFAGFSDKNGNYVIEGIIYNGTGENFNITPTITLSGAIHAFTPTNRILFLGEGSSTENNIDFVDKSSFNVRGSIVFNFDNVEGIPFKSAGSEGVSIWVDGTTQAMKDGKPILSDVSGVFTVTVPIGKHYLEFRKDGHVFESAKYPETGTFDFQDNLSGIEILDNTTHKLVGCVVGGLVQSRKIVGFRAYEGKLKPENQRVNNIGETYFTLTSVDTRIARKVFTDPETGDFEISLPPKEYEFSDIQYKSDNKVLFLKKDILSVELDHVDAYKGIEVEAPVLEGAAYVNKKVKYNAERRLAYRSTPSMIVQNYNAIDYLPNTKIGDDKKTTIGETKVKVFDTDTNVEVVIPTEDLPYPLFLQGKNYQTIIKAVEKYNYVGERPTNNPAIDEVPVLDGTVTVSNNISAVNTSTGSVAAYQKMDESWEILSGNIHAFDLQNEGSVNYTFVGGDPDLIIGTGPEDSYVKSMSIALKTGDKTIYWPEPTNQAGLYKGYVMGGMKLPGTDFTTEAPATIQTTIRMPPGSQSSVTIEKGSTFTTEESNSTQAGGDWSFGIGVGFEFEGTIPIINTKVASSEGSLMTTTYGSKYLGDEKTSVSTQGLSEDFTITSEDAFNNQESKGDFFISTSKNIEIGKARSLKFILFSNCVGDCNGPKVTGRDGLDYVLTTGETYYQKDSGKTFFLYSEDHIKNDIIFKLKNVRNSLFDNNEDNLYRGVYRSHLDANNPNYGLNNDDPRLGAAANNNDYTKDDAGDDDGNSYTFERAKAPNVNGIILDKVRWYNNQIRAWEEILMNNEIEKYAAIIGNKPEQKNVSISSGIAYTNTSTVESEEIRLESSELMAGASIDVEATFLGGAGFLVGPKTNLHGGGDKTFGWSKTNTESKAVTTSYTIQDNDPYNTYSINVFKGKGNDSPIFQIVGGQTSCPFEREKELEMTKNNIYYLEYWVAKIPKVIEEKTRIITDTYFANRPVYYFLIPTDWDSKRDAEIAEMSVLLNEKKSLYTTLIDSFKDVSKPLIGTRTVQIEKPGILVNGNDKAAMRNVPSSKAAIFDLELKNETELLPSSTSDAITYQLSVDPTSNPDGLVVLLNGENLVQPVPISIPFGQKIRQTLTVFRGPKLYNYKDLTLILESPCDGSIQETVKMDIDYIPVCAEATIASPGNNWTINYNSNNKLDLKIDSYDVNYQGFKGIKIQYKRSNESETSWKLLETYYRDTDARKFAGDDEVKRKAPLLTDQGGNDFIYNWDVSKLNDDLYDIRIQSMCQVDGQDVIYTSPTISGIIDRVNPFSFGSPQPSDGVLSSGDEIMIQFNEPINAGLLNPYNFDIRGVVQGGVIPRHPASVYFNGAGDYMEIPAGIQLNRRSFSFDFYAKRKRQGAEIVLSQGTTTGQSFSAGFNAANQFEVVLAGLKINSTKTIPVNDDWVHYAYTYDTSNQEAKLVINGELDVSKSVYAPNYEATGKIEVGKDGLAQNPSFQGNVHELRFWGKALTVGQIGIAATKRLQYNEPGLLGNWPMEETEGVLVKDIVKERHAQIISGTWQVDLTGNALKTNASIAPTIKSPAYLDVSDFSIEFWFKGNGTTQATLLSNGRGDSQDLNKNGWSINANASGLLEVRNNNKVFNASPKNFFDNQWHHFALVVNRMTNTVCFVDGNQQNSLESETLGFTGFGGAALHLGAMGWIDAVGATQQSQRFVGTLDEVRIWQGARNALQIKRDMRYMLSGDEAGLDLYLPFDKYKTSMGIETLEASNTSAANGDTAVKTNGVAAEIIGVVTYNQETPLLKLPRPVSKVNFSYSANQDKIILTTADADRILENVILDISVTGVQDLNGNIMRAPVTWTAYVDKNQVVWTESDKNFEIETGKGYTFTTAIKNTGGKIFNFNIKNLPVWISANPSSGVINPISTLPITFTIDKNINIGNYEQDLLLETEFGFDEVLNLHVDVVKPLPVDWKVNPSDFELSMNFVTQLRINGEISRDPNDKVAAFVGDECRGIAKLKYNAVLDNYQAFISVYSNSEKNEAIQFRIWNASDGQVHRDVTPTYFFQSNDVIGTLLKPEILNAVDVLEHTYNLPKGWTWISAHLNYNHNPSKQLKTKDLLQPINAVNGDLIRDIDSFDGYDADEGWAGTLTAKGGVKNGRGYKLFLNSANQLKYSGLLLKGEQIKIDLVRGWNWIGYIGFKNMTINQALAGFVEVSDGDVIKSQYTMAQYSPTVGWIGDLTYLEPGVGYMMRTAKAGNFYYPNLNYSASTSKFTSAATTSPINSISKTSKIESSYQYATNMNIIAEVANETIAPENTLRAYVGKELRGESYPVLNPLTNKQSYFMTIYGQKTDDTIRFEWFDASTNKTVGLIENFTFKPDLVLGNTSTPQLLTIAEPIQIDETILVYPNPFVNYMILKLYPMHKATKATIYDMLGHVVQNIDIKLSQNETRIEMINYPSGSYIISLFDELGTNIYTQQLLKK